MTSWLLSIIGVVFLGVLFDLIYPNGKTNNLCKSIFAILSLFVMISPILKLDINKLNVSTLYEDGLLEYINEAKLNTIQLEIDTNLTKEVFSIEKIYIDTTNIVLTENITNINKYDVIINEVSSLIKIEKERIIVYG